MRLINRVIGVMIVVAFVTLAGCAGSETSRSTGTYIDDKTIATKVKAQLAGDSVTQAIQVDVETYDGVVQLSGFVDSEKMRQRAVEIAQGVEGVKKVINNIELK